MSADRHDEMDAVIERAMRTIPEIDAGRRLRAKQIGNVATELFGRLKGGRPPESVERFLQEYFERLAAIEADYVFLAVSNGGSSMGEIGLRCREQHRDQAATFMRELPVLAPYAERFSEIAAAAFEARFRLLASVEAGGAA